MAIKNSLRKQLQERVFLFFSHSLQIHILTVFLVIMIATFGAIVSYSYHKNRVAVLDLGKNFLSISRKSLLKKTQDLLRNTQIVSTLMAQLYNDPDKASPDNIILVNSMREILRNHPQASSVYTATLSGDFLQISRSTPNEMFYGDPNKRLPPGTVQSLRFINGSSGNITETWYYGDRTNKTLQQEELSSVTYSFKDRPWFTSVIQSHRVEWSGLYVFSAPKKIGLTVSAPVFQSPDLKMVGVVGLDIDASQFTQLVQEETLSEKCATVIFNANTEVIAYSGEKDIVQAKTTETEDKVSTVFVRDLKDEKVVRAHFLFRKNKESLFTFTLHGIDYIASFEPLSSIESLSEHGQIEKIDSFKSWTIGTIVPTDEFIGSLKKVQKSIFWIALLLFLLVTVLMSLIIRRIAKPIVLLSEEALKIKTFDLDSDEEIRSSVIELQQLNNAIISMRHSMRAFSKFIPKVLVEKLLKAHGEVKIGGRLRNITLLFTDIENFTNVCEGYPADKLAVHLSEYFEEVTQIIMENNGVIDKYIGDAVMSFWGAPINDKDQAINACRTALYLQKRLDELNRKWAAEHKPALYTRIGIHTGEALVGNIGSSDRMNYTALGDSVNLAARLEGANKFYRSHIIISHDLYKAVEERCLVRPLDIIAVKGKQESVQIYELVSLLTGDPALLPTEEQRKFCALFAKGFRLYREKRWDEAISMFLAIEADFGNQYTVEMYIKRCKNFKDSPPPDDWDGTLRLHEK